MIRYKLYDDKDGKKVREKYFCIISDTEVYSTVYTNQMFQPDVFQTDYKPESERDY